MVRERKPFQRIDVMVARLLLDHANMLVLDVRDPKAFARGHIEGAANVDIRTLSSVIEATPRATPVLIYCYHGYASQEYAQIFSDFGFLEVFSLDGGYEAWCGAEDPAAPAETGLRELAHAIH